MNAADEAVLFHGKTLGASPLLERVTAAMGPHCAGVFASVGQHVPASSVRALVAEAERVGADALVAFGGGSPIDACKVAAASLLNRRDMTLVAGEIDFDGASRAGGAGREIRLVAVPTTLSAGEFTPGGGVTDEATRVKRRVADARLQHRTVIYDPELCLNTPDWLWVATGMRALDHAIEGIYSTRVSIVARTSAAYLLDFFFGTFLPSLRASESPMAIACFRLFTVFPLRPLLRVPSFRSCIAFSTFFEAPLAYFLAISLSPVSIDSRPLNAFRTSRLHDQSCV